jgi:hypothetical protein
MTLSSTLAPRDESLGRRTRSLAAARLGALPRWLSLLALVVLSGLALPACDYTDYNVPGYQKGYKPVQPISYSHKLHAGELQMDCKYCHFGAEKGRKAGVPPLNVCMNCHKIVRTDSPQIQKLTKAYQDGTSIPWVKVHNLPDFVAFDHSRHVNKGVACQTCHGPVEEMAEVYQYNSLAMGWCVNCHRQYNTNPPESLRDKHIHASIDCTGCHE